MKGLPGFGKPRRQRSVQYGYSTPASHWHRVKEHSHLVIAALGSFAFIAIAITAFWFTLPRNDKPVAARAAPQEMTAPDAADDAQPVVAETPAAPEAAPAVAAAPATEADPEIQPLALMPEPRVPEIDTQAAAAIIVPDAEAGDIAPETGSGTRTAAIPAPKPKPPAAAAAATGTGRITRGVTFRSGPGGSAIGTIPGGTEVKVISCDSWCEIVHKDQRGFVYKDFLDRD
ncbi:SH3 domain-containing protein [Aquamicrobium defluvii]|uniref:SH3 domain-containing protein n=1 Tax=Aquamicrobium defluvii TaxID=69279 RepID=A0A4V3DKC9_9HYPH|nr:SH3 domain-containing protein [Aquamicrobium defluvii]TDR33629.1 SH3 domain-containing protein [Aquamicrobium defluvii]